MRGGCRASMVAPWGWGGRLPPKLVGSNHEPSHCHCGMWLKRCRMLCINAEPGLPQVLSADRSAGDRDRAAGRRGEGLDGTELPYALSTHGPAGRGTVGDAGAQRLSAADRVGRARPRAPRNSRRIRSMSSCSRAPRRRRANPLRRRSRPRRPCASRRRQRPHRPCRRRRPHPPRLRRRLHRHQPLRQRLRRPPSRQRPRPTILGRRDSDGSRSGSNRRRRPAAPCPRRGAGMHWPMSVRIPI